MVLDESHYLVNPAAKRSVAVSLFVHAYCRPPTNVLIELSGTPFTTLNEAYLQLHLLQPVAFPCYMDFAQRPDKTFGFVNRYCTPHKDHFHHWVLNKGRPEMEAEFLQVFRATGMVRNLKETVLPSLPSKRRETITLPVSDPSTRDIFRLMDKRLAPPKPGKPPSKKQQYELMLVWNEQVKFRIPPVVQYFTDLWSPYASSSSFSSSSSSSSSSSAESEPAAVPVKVQKWVLFAYHEAMLDALDELVQLRLGWKRIRIDGKVAGKKRQDLAQAFQTDPNVRVALLNLQAGSTAITLTAANVLYLVESHPSDKTTKQAEDRCHRIGQLDTVRIITLCVEGSIDSRMGQIIRRKFVQVDRTIDQKSA
jgi:SWI/SNF-related matrix-associated actin-dependent regulator of chromatin subfamily A-like protein 1